TICRYSTIAPSSSSPAARYHGPNLPRPRPPCPGIDKHGPATLRIGPVTAAPTVFRRLAQHVRHGLLPSKPFCQRRASEATLTAAFVAPHDDCALGIGADGERAGAVVMSTTTHGTEASSLDGSIASGDLLSGLIATEL